MSSSYTNYTIVNPTTGEALALVKAEGVPAKIQANEYTLKSVRFVR